MDRMMVSASSGAMNSLLGKLTTLLGEEFAKLKNLRKEVKFISDELSSMKDLLERLADVDELDPQTKRWGDIVREMSYDIEDIIDDFMQNIGKKNESSGFVSSTIRRLKTSRARHRIAGQIKGIKELVRETSERRQRYKLHIPTSSDVAVDQRVVILYANTADLVGLEGPKNELVNWLLDEEKQLKVVSIVGFGGLGKTTLANVVHRKLKGEFSCDAFVPVSQKPNISTLLGNLLSELLRGQSFNDCGLNVLLDKLREYLQNKRYLIVIDDLWDVSAWDVIKYAFPENNLGSRVIATTRNQDVAKACCFHPRDYILNMKPLSRKDSIRLFLGRIFGSEEACPQQLRNVSVEILKKCGGLPLAIVSISSLLAVEGLNQKEKWENVRNSMGSMYGTNLTLEGMRQILNLSYKNLPHCLRTCFLYLGMYPNDYIIRRSDLERQWTAEGFVSTANGQDVDKIARSYFNELVNRSLIQLVFPVNFDQSEVSCKVHDMMLDLILCKSVEENFITVVDDPNAITGMTQKPRRLSFCLDGARNGAILPRNISVSQVRSLMIFRNSQNIPPLSEFKFLRVLFVMDGEKTDLTGICKLYQLRYLRIGGRCHLPTQIRGLQHLETFDINICPSIPSDIVHLTHLLHLSVGDLSRLPDGIGNMKSLRYLDSFDLGTNSLGNIRGLEELTNLRNLTLTCYDDPNDMTRRLDVLCSSLGKLCSIKYLVFGIWNGMDGLMSLSPPPCNLEMLHMFKDAILGSWFSRVPNWMAEQHNLTKLELNVGELLKDGIDILAELPSLVHLHLCIHRRPIKEKIVIYGTAFPALKSFQLRLSSVSYLTFQSGAMPKLQRLKLEFNAQGSEQNEPGPAGVEHLSALEEFSAKIGCMDATESDVRSANSSIRSAIQNHPSYLRGEITHLDGGELAFHDSRLSRKGTVWLPIILPPIVSKPADLATFMYLMVGRGELLQDEDTTMASLLALISSP